MLRDIECSPNIGEDTKALIKALRGEFSTMKAEMTELINSKNETITQLQSRVEKLQNELEDVKAGIDDADAYSRRECAIFSGNAVPPSSADEDPAKTICNVVKEKLKLIMNPNEISTAHRLGPKPPGQGPDNRKIIVKFCRRDKKQDLFIAAKKTKAQGLYINECLTPTRRSLAHSLSLYADDVDVLTSNFISNLNHLYSG